MTAGTRVANQVGRPRAKVHRTRAACSECGAQLSSYNPGPNCFAHTLDVPWKGPGVRAR